MEEPRTPPTVAEPTVAHDPYPPQPDQAAPEVVSRRLASPPARGSGPCTVRSAPHDESGDTAATTPTTRSRPASGGPTLLQDHHLREKITHFDHERIPERVVHARGAGAHGVFVGYGTASSTSPRPASSATASRRRSSCGSRRCWGRAGRPTRSGTPAASRRSSTPTRAPSTSSATTSRSSSSRTASSSPTSSTPAKPHPDREIPQAQSRPRHLLGLRLAPHRGSAPHDVGHVRPRHPALLPDDGGLRRPHLPPRADAEGETTLVKFHWKPRRACTPSSGRRRSCRRRRPRLPPPRPRRRHRGGRLPQWELGIQIFADTPEQTVRGDRPARPDEAGARGARAGAADRSAHAQRPTPRTSSPRPSRSPSTSATSCPGIDVTNDPLLQARLFSYVDTQLTRLGGPNFNQIPINRPHAPVNDMLRDGFHQHAVHSGVAPYRPNSLDGGCPFHAAPATGAFVEVPGAVPESDEGPRAEPASFDDHFSQARLFWLSMPRSSRTTSSAPTRSSSASATSRRSASGSSMPGQHRRGALRRGRHGPRACPLPSRRSSWRTSSRARPCRRSATPYPPDGRKVGIVVDAMTSPDAAAVVRRRGGVRPAAVPHRPQRWQGR